MKNDEKSRQEVRLVQPYPLRKMMMKKKKKKKKKTKKKKKKLRPVCFHCHYADFPLVNGC